MNVAAKLLAMHAALDRSAGAAMPSPCISVCKMDASNGLCQGCLRTIPEITAWSRIADPQKREIWDRLAQRALQKDTA